MPVGNITYNVMEIAGKKTQLSNNWLLLKAAKFRTLVMVSYRTTTFSKSQCAINITATIDFKDQLKAIACNRPGKQNNLCSGTMQTAFTLEIFLPQSHNCSQQRSSNEYQSPFSPDSVQIYTRAPACASLFHTYRGKTSQTSVTISKLNCLLEDRRKKTQQSLFQ